MSDKSQDLTSFSLRVIRMYSELLEGDTVALGPGKQVLRSGTAVA